ncbi:MAG: hypothetical protein ACK5LZ_05365, partial [Anaerorhabdus sp.]
MGLLGDIENRDEITMDNYRDYITIDNYNEEKVISYLENPGITDAKLGEMMRAVSLISEEYALQALNGEIGSEVHERVMGSMVYTTKAADMLKMIEMRDHICNIELSAAGVIINYKEPYIAYEPVYFGGSHVGEKEVTRYREYEQHALFYYPGSNDVYSEGKNALNIEYLKEDIANRISELDKEISKLSMGAIGTIGEYGTVEGLIAKLMEEADLAAAFSGVLVIRDLYRQWEMLNASQKELEQANEEMNIVNHNNSSLDAAANSEKKQISFEQGSVYKVIGSQVVELGVSAPIANVTTAKTMKAIDEAAIISQGKGTEGYEEAMQASYETAVANGSYDSYESFSQSYGSFAVDNAEQLQEMSELSLTELVERYEEFKGALGEIDDNLKILGY